MLGHRYYGLPVSRQQPRDSYLTAIGRVRWYINTHRSNCKLEWGAKQKSRRENSESTPEEIMSQIEV